MGQRNPKQPKKAERDSAEHLTAEIVDPKRVRSSLRTLQRAVENGWEVPQNLIQAAPLIVGTILSDRNMSAAARLRAAEVLSAMVRDRVNAAIALDRIERLDEGSATERVEISPEVRARVAAIIAKRLTNDPR